MPRPALVGIHHVKIPVTDLDRAVDWYGRVFGFVTTMEFPDADGRVLGVAGDMPGLADAQVTFRVNLAAAAGCRGFDPVSYAVAGHADVEAWAGYLDELGISHSPVIEASVGWLLVFHDPDGLELHLYSTAAHGIDHSARPGYGRAVIRAAVT